MMVEFSADTQPQWGANQPYMYGQAFGENNNPDERDRDKPDYERFAQHAAAGAETSPPLQDFQYDEFVWRFVCI